MAQFPIAYDWTMGSEDGPKPYRYKTVMDSNGAYVISGINEAAFPADFARINAIPQAERGPAVEEFYQRVFWNQWLEQLVSDEVAKRTFDHGFNNNPRNAVKILQRAIPAAGGIVVGVDGFWGAATLSAANACEESALVATFINCRQQFYRDLAVANPSLVPYLQAWLVRAGK